MPENTVSVTRPGRFGNPFTSPIVNDPNLSLKLFSEMAEGCWNPYLLKGFSDHNVHQIYEAHRAWLLRIGKGHPIEIIRYELRGKNLACFCPLDQHCHADILLELANR